MNDLYNILNEETEVAVKKELPYSKEVYAQKMNERRTKLFNLANSQTMEAVATPQAYLNYLNMQSKLGYTVTNTMLVMAQNPNATLLKDITRWRENKMFIKKGEKGIEILEPSGEYLKKDNSVGVNYKPKFVFDVSQINLKSTLEKSTPKFNPNELVSAIMYQATIKPEVVKEDSTLPTDVYYDNQTNKIYVKNGLETNTMIQGLIREYCFVECAENGISRSDAQFLAESASYMISQKYGIDCDTTAITNKCQGYFSNKEQREVKGELENIKNVFENVDDRMEKGLYSIQQSKQQEHSEVSR